ncbi:MAG: hypothetical protein IKG87_08185 [Clostridia bacterium]|nr:hypothetical protein [Clostridia bacterium]
MNELLNLAEIGLKKRFPVLPENSIADKATIAAAGQDHHLRRRRRKFF